MHCICICIVGLALHQKKQFTGPDTEMYAVQIQRCMHGYIKRLKSLEENQTLRFSIRVTRWM